MTSTMCWWRLVPHSARLARQISLGGYERWSGPAMIRTYHHSDRHWSREGHHDPRSGKRLWAIGVCSLALGGVLYAECRRRPLIAATYSKGIPGERVFGYKEYSAVEVAKHTTKDKRVWVTFKDGVYDVTDFIDQHPGGDNIMLGAGGAVDPFWHIYGVHKKKEILALLEEYRIGNLMETDNPLKNLDDPYASDPPRHAALKPTSVKPFNAEPPLRILAENFYTPKYCNLGADTFYFVSPHANIISMS